MGTKGQNVFIRFFKKKENLPKNENLPPILTFFYKKSKKVKIKNQQNQKIIKKVKIGGKFSFFKGIKLKNN